MHREHAVYPGLDMIFATYLHQDWNHQDTSLVKVLCGALNELQLGDISKKDLEMFSLVSLPQFYSEIFDVVKRKTVDEQFMIYDSFRISGPNIPFKHNVECFFITVLYLTETEMRRRGIEIPGNPPLHTTTV